MSQHAFERSGTAWISKGFETLVTLIAADEAERSFDVLIVGSGYGGAIAADTLSRCTKQDGESPNICILERGNEYLPGEFPANSTELPRHIRFGRNNEGLFDFRGGEDVAALVANGLGGGSLINAGVMKAPIDKAFAKGWPDDLNSKAKLNRYLERVRQMLGSRYGAGLTRSEISKDKNDDEFSKLEALKRLDVGNKFSPAEITAAGVSRPNSGYVQLEKCNHCGDCVTGCNHNAKDSLDTNLLVNAFRREAKIYTGATVLKVVDKQDGSGWFVDVVFTDANLRKLHVSPLRLSAENVILAAGTFGSAEILKRSEAAGLKLSRMLGQRCSTNGDTMITHFDSDEIVNGLGKEEVRPDDRRVGPTITGILDYRDYPADTDLDGLLIEEMASPASMRRVFSELYATVNTLHRLGDCDRTTHKTEFPDDDIYELSEDQIDRSALYAVMGDDGAHGEIEINGPLDDIHKDGIARMRWPGIAEYPLFDQQVQALKKLTEGAGGHILQNPMWKLLPDDISLITQMETGPVVTVHPLGGCAMANTSTDGVVNHKGAVFRYDDDDRTYEGLAVLDGSIIPVSLGVNPALTIAAVSLRAAMELASDWGLNLPDDAWDPTQQAVTAFDQEAENEFSMNGAVGPDVREKFRDVEIKQSFQPTPTMVRLTERLSGSVSLGFWRRERKEFLVELTLRFDEKSLRELTNPSSNSPEMKLQIDGDDPVTRSKLRIFDPRLHEVANRRALPPRELDELLDSQALFRSDFADGTLQIFKRRWSWVFWRILRTGFAWARNHGLRDVYRAWQSPDDRREQPRKRDMLRSLIALCTHAGEVRTFRYDLTLKTRVPWDISRCLFRQQRIVGEKKFTYGMLSNPWNQLMELRLKRFPGRLPLNKSKLNLDLPYLANIRIPLLEFMRQNEGVTALAEFGSFIAYIGRMLIGIHGMNFRSPDEPRDVREPERLPGKVIGIDDEPEIFEIYLGKERPARSELEEDDPAAKVPAYARLTRYTGQDNSKPPIVMMHGYSASGTTFTHNTIDDNYVKYFHDRGRDVWVADFRTSCGMPTAREPWSFEQVGYRDVPEIIKFICQKTNYRGGNNEPKVDVIAHCMGAAMFSMGLLRSKDHALGQFANRDARNELTSRINRVVFTQVGPLLVMSPMNIFRGYVMQYFRELLPDRYEFNPGPFPTVVDRLLDRFLMTVPYPREEYRIENPVAPWKRTPWTRTRHRMDVLYGRVFNAENVDEKVLNHIDDFFGPLSIDTVTQTINFARYNVITDTVGRNTFVSRKNLEDNWGDTPLCQINADNNGLVDVKTVYRMEPVFDDAGRSFEFDIVEDAGHQDCLIGNTPKEETLEKINNFLEKNSNDLKQTQAAASEFIAYPPWIGPVRTFETTDGSERSFRVGSRPTHHYAEGVLLFRVLEDNGQITMPDSTPFTGTAASRQYLFDYGRLISSTNLKERFWDKFLFPPIPAGLNPSGNAWVALMIYNESKELHEYNDHYYANVTAGQPGLEGVTYIGQLNPGDDWRFPYDELLEMTEESGSVEELEKKLLASGGLLSADIYERILTPVVELMGRQDMATGYFRDTLQNEDRPSLITDEDYHEFFSSYAPSLADVNAVIGRLNEEHLDLRDGLMPDVDNVDDEDCRFVLSSCQFPAGFFDGPIAYRSYEESLRRIDPSTAPGDGNTIVPRFAILTGDQIYADASAGLFDPSVKRGRFELPYHVWLRFPYVRGVLRQLPSFMVLDDHEINDNWESIPGDSANKKLRDDGHEGYVKYQRGQNQPSPLPITFDGCDFMLIDSRSNRAPRAADSARTAKMVDPAIIANVGTVIGNRGQNDPPLFIVTPSMLLPRHKLAGRWDLGESSLRSDGWDGYPASLFHLLQQVVDENGKNVVFLSGDEHMPCRCKIRIRNKNNGAESIVYSIHTAAAYAPFPFANGFRAQQVENETLHFNVDANSADYMSDEMEVSGSDPANFEYECEIASIYPPADDSMTYLRAWKSNGHWSLLAQFGDHPDLIDDLESW